MERDCDQLSSFRQLKIAKVSLDEGEFVENASLPRPFLAEDQHLARGVHPDDGLAHPGRLHGNSSAAHAQLYHDAYTFIKEQDYTAPTEWGVYGNKTYIITFGDDAMAMIIDSESIAEGLRQILKIIEKWQKRLPEYKYLPLLASS